VVFVVYLCIVDFVTPREKSVLKEKKKKKKKKKILTITTKMNELLKRVLKCDDLASFFASCCELGKARETSVEQQGRVGPERAVLHRPYCAGGMDCDVSLTKVAGRSSFCTVRANVAVFAGKWMYEAVVLTGGLAQIGWASLRFVLDLFFFCSYFF
jgi:hypothetical protein